MIKICSGGGAGAGAVIALALAPWKQNLLLRTPASRSVHIHGRVSLRASPRISPSSTHAVGERPPDPASLVSGDYLSECVDEVSFQRCRFFCNLVLYF